jgi:hypothetical protein
MLSALTTDATHYLLTTYQLDGSTTDYSLLTTYLLTYYSLLTVHYSLPPHYLLTAFRLGGDTAQRIPGHTGPGGRAAVLPWLLHSWPLD